MSTLGARLTRLDAIRVDIVFAAAMLVELELVCSMLTGISREHRIVTAVASLLFVTPLAVRRRSPGSALVAAAFVAAVQVVFGGVLLSTAITDQVGSVVVIVALSYAVGAWLDTRPSLVAFIVGLALVEASQFLPGGGPIPRALTAIASAAFYCAFMVAPAWLVGRLARRHSQRSEAFRELAALSGSEREAREAVAGERARIDSELHDVIAQSVSAMVVQAGGARLLLDSDPDRARAAILNVEHTGREALADLRRMLGMLRKNDDPRALSPQPGLTQVRDLVDAISRGGVTYHLRTLGNKVDLTPGVDLAAYRVVESALLAATAHHEPHEGAVTIRYAPHQLELEVRGDTTIPDLAERTRSIAQRVALYGGTLRAVPQFDDGFVLEARLPLAVGIPA